MKIFKPIAIGVVSIVALAAIATTIALYVVLTPERLTPIIEKQIEKQLGLDISIKEADITLFSSFPELQIRVEEFAFSPIAQVKNLYGTVDLKRLMQGDIVVNKIYLNSAYFDICTDTLAEMGLYPTTTDEEEEDSEAMSFDQNILITAVEMSDLKLNFVDSSTKISSKIEVPNLSLNGSMCDNVVDMKMEGSLLVEKLSVADTVAVEEFNISQLRMAVDGSLKSNKFDVDAKSKISVGEISLNGDTMLKAADISFDLPATIAVEEQSINLREASFALNGLSIKADGSVINQDGDNLLVDLAIASNRWDYNTITPLIPAPYRAEIEKFTKSGGAVQADLHAYVDMSQAQKSNITITSALMELGANRVEVSGVVGDALDSVDCDLDIKARANIAELLEFVPDSMDLNVVASGVVDGDVSTQFKLDDATSARIEKIRAKGNVAYSDLKVRYNDSINLVNNRGAVDFTLAQRRSSDHIIDLKFTGDNIDYTQVGVGRAQLLNPTLKASMSNPMDTTKILSAVCDYGVKDLKFDSDSVDLRLMGADGNITMHAENLRSDVPVMRFKYHSDSLAVNMVDVMKANTGNIAISARTTHDATQERLLLKWNPLLNVDFNNGQIELADIEPTIYIPAIKFDYLSEDLVIHDSRIVIQDSDFALHGSIGNIRSCIEHDEKLIGELNYYSKRTDLDQLMAISQEFVETDEASVQDEPSDALTEDSATADSETITPFMIPKKVSLILNSEVESAIFNEKPIYDIKGSVVMDNGELVMDQVGFRSEAAKMYLTAIYRPERINHIYTGFNFHLVDIDIDALVDIIPTVDTIMPMLKDFDGKAEFHFAGETYLTSSYEPKMSTLRGAMAIKGEDLVLLDNATFTEISKMLMFSKKARNVIDSLSVEATLFREEVEVYPFLIAMDRWQGIISGRHNLDMNYDYHVSVVDCPVPIKLGVDIKGNMEDFNFKLVPCKYKALYNPKKQGAVEKQILEFKSIVSESLINNLKSRKDYTPSIKAVE